eukprot:10591_1
MSNTTALPKRVSAMGQSTPEYSRNNNVMLSIVENALHKLYEGKNEPNPLIPYQQNILNYFQQNNVDLIAFHKMKKAQFITCLKRHIFGSLEPHKNTEEALALLIGYIDFVAKVPRKPPTPSTTSQSTRIIQNTTGEW